MSTPTMTFEEAVSYAVEVLERHVPLKGAAAAEVLARALGPVDERPKITSPAHVNDHLRSRIAYEDREHFVALLLDTKNHVISTRTISIGTLNASLVHPREVLKPAIAASAHAIIIAHNHPSGDTAPSAEDITVTHKIRDAGELCEIQLLDHVIIGSRGYISLKERGDL